MKARILLPALLFAGSAWLNAAPLTESTFTEVIKDVNVVASATKAATPAKAQDLVKAPDLVRTGPESRAELTAPDQTLTRIGANTVFSFEAEGRNLNLERGSLLFHSPSGKGGGTIRSGGASAAVLGTTLIVVATPGGGFKVVFLENNGKVMFPNGKTVKLKAGQIIFILPGQTKPGEPLDINLGKLIAGSLLVNGFSHELPSMPLIKEAIKKQEQLIAKGRAEDLGIPADQFVRKRRVGTLDNDTYAMLTIPQVQKLQTLRNQNQGGQGTPSPALGEISIGLGLQDILIGSVNTTIILGGIDQITLVPVSLPIMTPPSVPVGDSGAVITPIGSSTISGSVSTSYGVEVSRARNAGLVQTKARPSLQLPPRPTTP